MAGSFSCKVYKTCQGDTCANFGFHEYQLDNYFDEYYYPGVGAEGCYKIPNSYKDGPLRAGYAFAVLAAIIGVIPLLGSISTTFLRIPRKFMLGLAGCCFVLAAFSLFVGSIGLASNNCDGQSPFGPGAKCKPGTGAGLNYTAFLLYVGAGLSFIFLQRFERDIPDTAEASNKVLTAIFGHPETSHSSWGGDTHIKSADFSSPTPDLVERESVVQPDGSVTTTVTTTHTNPDCSKVVAKVIENGPTLIEKESVVQSDGSVTTTVTTTYTNPDGSKVFAKGIENGPTPPHAQATVLSHGDHLQTVPDGEDDFTDSDNDDEVTTCKTTHRTKTKDDGTIMDTEIKTYTHRDGQKSSVKTQVFRKALEDGTTRVRTLITTTDVDGKQTKEKSTKIVAGEEV